jgi:hypothetical protein
MEGDFVSNLEWLREAELAHGRMAQLAVIRFIWPGLFGTFPGSDEFGSVDDYSELNPLKAITTVPESVLHQIVAGMEWFEYQRVVRIKEKDRVLGDIGTGYPGGWNPLNIIFIPSKEYAEKQLQKIKHGRANEDEATPSGLTDEFVVGVLGDLHIDPLKMEDCAVSRGHFEPIFAQAKSDGRGVAVVSLGDVAESRNCGHNPESELELFAGPFWARSGHVPEKLSLPNAIAPSDPPMQFAGPAGPPMRAHVKMTNGRGGMAVEEKLINPHTVSFYVPFLSSLVHEAFLIASTFFLDV